MKNFEKRENDGDFSYIDAYKREMMLEEEEEEEEGRSGGGEGAGGGGRERENSCSLHKFIWHKAIFTDCLLKILRVPLVAVSVTRINK
jgi:hypothetical protein